jgi:alpha-mannosidase
VRTTERSLANDLLTVEVEPAGTVRLVAADGTEISGAGRIADGGDYGDSYNYAPPAADTLVEEPSSVSVSMEADGPVISRLRISRTYDWPRGVLRDGSSRTADVEATDVVTTVELRAGEPFARFAVAFTNHSDDHRVRFHVPVPRRADRSHAEGQFAVVERGLTGEGGYREEPLATFPAHGWVDAGGLAVLLDHIVEYELADGGVEMALTLLRSTGLISRNDNPYRQDPAGPEMAIPGAQMRGRHQVKFALFPHAGEWTDGGVADAAERYRHPFVWTAGAGSADASWPPPHAGNEGLALEGDQVALSSLRRRSDGWLEARVVNLAADARTAVVRGDLTDAREASLRGEPGEALPVADGAVRLHLRPAEIRTIQLRRRDTAAGKPDVLDASGPRQSA